MNHLCKAAFHGLQANKTSKSIVHVSKSSGILKEVTEQFNEDNGIPLPSGAHSAPSMKKDRDLIILQKLLTSAVFTPRIARNHVLFPHAKMWMTILGLKEG